MLFRKKSRSRRAVLEPGQVFRESGGVAWEIVKALSLPNETPHYLLQRVDNPARRKTVSLSALQDKNYYVAEGPRLVNDELEA